jgi:hypothetical protein
VSIDHRPPARREHGAIATRAPSATERVFAGYLAVQALAGVGWWVALALSPTVRSWFELAPGRPEVMDAFVVADAAVIAGSALAARGLATGAAWAVPVVAFTAGGLVYPTLYLVGWVARTGAGGPTLAIMVPPSVLTCWVAVHARHRRHDRNG